MANRTFFDVQSSNREVKIIATKVKIGTEPAATAVLTDSSGTDVSTNGVKKAEVIANAIEGPITAQVTASVLQLHPDCVAILDQEAATKLKRADYYIHVEKMSQQLGK